MTLSHPDIKVAESDADRLVTEAKALARETGGPPKFDEMILLVEAEGRRIETEQGALIMCGLLNAPTPDKMRKVVAYETLGRMLEAIRPHQKEVWAVIEARGGQR